MKRVPTLTIATLLSPLERVHVDAASSGAYTTLHRTSIDELRQDLRAQRASALLLSVARYDAANAARMADVIREFPRIPTFALLTGANPITPHAVLSLGQLGVRSLVDARHASGWNTLRTLMAHEDAHDIQRQLLATLSLDLATAPADCWRFFELIITHRPIIGHARQLARLLNVVPTTLVSRFYRAKLPSPKRYIDLIRLVRAARLFENPGLSISAVVRQLDYSSPQSFGRHVRITMGLSPVAFRATHSGLSMLHHFRETLITPHRDVLQSFRPLDALPPWVHDVPSTDDDPPERNERDAAPSPRHAPE